MFSANSSASGISQFKYCGENTVAKTVQLISTSSAVSSASRRSNRLPRNSAHSPSEAAIASRATLETILSALLQSPIRL